MKYIENVMFFSVRALFVSIKTVVGLDTVMLFNAVDVGPLTHFNLNNKRTTRLNFKVRFNGYVVLKVKRFSKNMISK